MPCAQAEDRGLLGPLQSPDWVKVYLASTVLFHSVSVERRVEKYLGLCVGDRVLCLQRLTASASRAGGTGIALCWRVVPVTFKCVLWWLPNQPLGIVRASARTGWPGVSIRRLPEAASLIIQLLSQSGSAYNSVTRSVTEIHFVCRCDVMQPRH